MVDAGEPAEPLSYADSGRRSSRVGLVRWFQLWGLAIKLLREAAPGPALFVLAAQIIGGLAMVVQLALAGVVLTRLTSGETLALGKVGWPLAGAAAMLATSALASSLSNELSLVVTSRVARTAQERILDVAIAADLEAYETPGFHDRLVRAQANADDRSWMVAQASAQLLTAMVGVVAVGAVVASRQPWVAAVLFVGAVPLWLAARRNSSQLYQLEFDQTPRERERGYLQELMVSREGAPELRVFGLGEPLLRRYLELSIARVQAVTSLAKRRMVRSALAAVLSAGAAAAALILVVRFVVDGSLSVADAGVVAIGLWQLQNRVAGFMVSAALLQEAGRFLDDYVSFTDLAPAVRASQLGPVAPAGFRKLRVEGLSFNYPGTDRRVLDDISLEIDAGEVVALVGANGSGKTTLAKLLSGLYRPTEGAIWWDDERFDLADRRSAPTRVGALFQQFGTYQLSARENVGFGDPARIEDQAALDEAADRAGVGGLIRKLADGWDTRLSREYEAGVELSVGQWQRVALARAFFRDAPFLVLDEPTSALDPRAEADLFASLKRLYAGRTVLLISHRFSSVRSADWIYVLDEGRIIEQGSHDDLMAATGRYCELFTLQAAAYLDDVVDVDAPARASRTARWTAGSDPGRLG